jgi:hypothetical protein
LKNNFYEKGSFYSAKTIWFNTPQLVAVTGAAGDMFPREAKILR